MNFAPWEKAVRCSGRAMPGAVRLLNWLVQSYPVGWSGGIYNCRPVRGQTSMSIHAEGRAVDFMLPVQDGKAHPVGDEIVRRLGSEGDRLGIQCIIWDRRIYSKRSPNGRPYRGVNMHIDHLHIELNRRAATGMPNLGAPVAQQRPTLRRGARGAHVQNLQQLLGGLAIDGIFGPKTEQAVRAFQQARGLKVDGIAGPRTWAALT